MKFLLLLCLLVTLSACQLTSLSEHTHDNKDSSSNKDASQLEAGTLHMCPSPSESTDNNENDEYLHNSEQCEIAELGVIKVIHPIEEVDVALKEPEPFDPNSLSNLWETIQHKLNFPIPKNQARIEAQKKWFLRHPTYMRRVSKRARPFLYYIAQRLEEENMPMELILLPIVESGFDPFAYSQSDAAGMWQFIPSSGKRYGMKQTWWYEGRRDVIASTNGAIAYMRYLNNMFDGNWLHALAAYNSGEGRVSRSIRKNKRAGKPTDFWSLDLPKETRAYVPKLLALVDILKHQEEYNFSWPPIANEAVIEVVNIDSQIDLALAASMANLSIAELKALNPGYNRWATDPKGPHELVIPIDKADAFSIALAKVDQKDRLNWLRHKVKSGENLGVIANNYNSSIEVIKQVNNLKNNTIYIDDYILVPASLKSEDAYRLSANKGHDNARPNERSSQKVVHIISRGDTLWDIAVAHKVSVRELAKWNNISSRSTLKLGTKLVVWTKPLSTLASTESGEHNVVYIVRSGDSLARIASKFNVKVRDLTKWNNLQMKKYLQPGQKIKIRVDV
jgi:membrane-bound lytic murein transglycosylase D